jgi:hypothetical protein
MLLLQRGGEVAYAGPINQLSAYLESVGYGACPEGRNIADFALEVAGGGIRDAPVDAAPAPTAASEVAKATADTTATAPTRSGGTPAARFSQSARCVEVKKNVAALGHDIQTDFQRMWARACGVASFCMTILPLLCCVYLSEPIPLGDPVVHGMCESDTATGFCEQYSALTHRFFVSIYRDTPTFTGRMGSAVVIAVCV